MIPVSRTAARQMAMQISFALSGGSDTKPEEFFDEEYFRSLSADNELFLQLPDEDQRTYILSIVQGIEDHKEEIDGCISRLSRGWKTSRISKTALTVLRCAVYEMLYMPDIPDAVAINEAVEAAKKYDEPETVRFINGILGSVSREKEAEPENSVTSEE